MQAGSPAPTASTRFQSTLPVAGERCILQHPAAARQTVVSIHAPRCRGAMPRKPSTTCSTMAVSIHAPRCRGAMRGYERGAFEAGRFNPRSPLPGSDAAALGVALVGLVVSIHAPRCRGAMHRAALFNSGAYPVSIHAPRCRGAMHAGRPVGPHGRLGFNPRSPLPGSDAAPVLGLGGKAKMFQSTLPVAGERCDYGSSNLRCSSVFQSTLPVAGERCYSHHQLRPSERRVSIHAPRCRGAMPAWLSSSSDLTATFQSTLPVAGERCMAAGSWLASMS